MLILEVLKVTRHNFNKSVISPDLFLLVSTAAINFSACQLLYKTSFVIRKYIFTLPFLHIHGVVAVRRFFFFLKSSEFCSSIHSGKCQLLFRKHMTVTESKPIIFSINTLVLYLLVNSVLKENKLLTEKFIQQCCLYVLYYKTEINLLYFFQIHSTFSYPLSFPSFVHIPHTHMDIGIKY